MVQIVIRLTRCMKMWNMWYYDQASLSSGDMCAVSKKENLAIWWPSLLAGEFHLGAALSSLTIMSPTNHHIVLNYFRLAQRFAQIRACPNPSMRKLEHKSKRAQKLSQIFVQIKTQIEVTIIILTSICAIFLCTFRRSSQEDFGSESRFIIFVI